MIGYFATHTWSVAAAAFVAASAAVAWIHPYMVRIAREKNIVDNPDRRKLQRTPVPVLGGVAVFFGVVLGTAAVLPCCGYSFMPAVFAMLMLMLYTGTMDDILGLSPRLRFAIEIAAVAVLVLADGYAIDDFHGLWNIGIIPSWTAFALTIVASVGIINSINLIDGVDGLSSGYCIMACTVFGMLFHARDDVPMTILAAACTGALIPFFGHNVFGKSSKMFIGDGGTLFMGMVMSVFVVRALDNGSMAGDEIIAGAAADNTLTTDNFGAVPFTLAVLAVPVFDTLRVMSVRVARGKSPFKPDRTHLHHIFIELGFSPIGTTAGILVLNMLIIAGWWGMWRCGMSVDTQLYVVAGMAFLATSGFVLCARLAQRMQRADVHK